MGVSSPLVSSTIGVAEGFSSDVPASPAAVVGAEASIERDSSMNWRKLFGADSNQPLQFFPPKVQDGEVCVQPPAEVFAEGDRFWTSSLVAQFLGSPPNFSFMQKIVFLSWGKGWRSYHHCSWSSSLYMDSITASKSRLTFAKVCVEIDADKALPKSVNVVLRDGSIASIGVFVPWMLVSFKKKVALAEGTSRMNGEVVWVPKKISLVHVQGKCSDEGVNIVAGDVSVIDDSVNGKSVIAGSSNRFVVLVDVDHAQVSSTSHVVGEASVRVSMAENDASGQAAEHVTRQPREAAKAVARIVQDFKAKKQNKGGARKHNKGGRKDLVAMEVSFIGKCGRC
ncbi:hypothetical protein V6N13_070827 [Hibiscus sabdariffa]